MRLRPALVERDEILFGLLLRRLVAGALRRIVGVGRHLGGADELIVRIDVARIGVDGFPEQRGRPGVVTGADGRHAGVVRGARRLVPAGVNGRLRHGPRQHERGKKGERGHWRILLRRPGVECPGMGETSSSGPDRIVFDSGAVCVGEFRCATDHPLFRNSGPCSHYCFVFPRTAVIIRHANARIVADPTVTTLYNRAQEYEREPLSPRGDACEWYGVSPALLRDALAEARSARGRRGAAADPFHARADRRAPLPGAATPVPAREALRRRPFCT